MNRTPAFRLIRTEPYHTLVAKGTLPLVYADGEQTVRLDQLYEGGPLALEIGDDSRIYPISLADGEALDAGNWRVKRDDSCAGFLADGEWHEVEVCWPYDGDIEVRIDGEKVEPREAMR